LSSEAVTAETTPYDEVPYASFPFAQSHPNRLATVATLFGMQPPALDACRVLELGCASGGNLIPMAAGLPGGEFIGFDLSQRQITDGRKMIADLRLANVRLEAQSILDITPDLGKFDYIISHGVWSWVPAEVREKILAICRDQLNPQGVAFISYNTYPGWHMRGTVRDMMVYHARKFATPNERVAHGRALLDFLSRSVTGEGNTYAMLLKNEMEILRNKSDSYLLHEHLEHVNEPVYFYQFEEQISKLGLQYLAESEVSAMLAQSFTSEVEQIIRRLSSNIIEMEQYLDFLKNRTFRQTLICHRAVKLNRRPDSRALRPLRVAGLTNPVEGTVDLSDGVQMTFEGRLGRITTGDPGAKTALVLLREAWPKSIRFPDLLAMIYERLAAVGVPVDPTVVNEVSLGSHVLHCYLRGFFKLVITDPPCASQAGERPKGAAVARWYANAANYVTNQAHEMVQLSDFARQTLILADGTRDRAALAAELKALIAKNAVIIKEDAERALPVEVLLERALAVLAAHSVLVE